MPGSNMAKMLVFRKKCLIDLLRKAVDDIGGYASRRRITRCCFHCNAADRSDDKKTPMQFSQSQNVIDQKDIPICFSESEAAKWTSSDSFASAGKDVPFYQPFVVVTSIVVFLIYFAALREENDMDKMLGRSLFEIIPSLEEKQIQVDIKFNKEHGLSTVDLETRLKQLQS